MYIVVNIVDNIYLYSQYEYNSHCLPSVFRKNITILNICKCFVFIWGTIKRRFQSIPLSEYSNSSRMEMPERAMLVPQGAANLQPSTVPAPLCHIL